MNVVQLAEARGGIEFVSQGLGKHQRNWGFNWPLSVYMPVAAKRRNAALREAAIRFPARRSCRASACIAFGSLLLRLTTLFMREYFATPRSRKQPVLFAVLFTVSAQFAG